MPEAIRTLYQAVTAIKLAADAEDLAALLERAEGPAAIILRAAHAEASTTGEWVGMTAAGAVKAVAEACAASDERTSARDVSEALECLTTWMVDIDEDVLDCFSAHGLALGSYDSPIEEGGDDIDAGVWLEHFRDDIDLCFVSRRAG